MTITPEDSPEEAACIVIKMMAIGIPSYSIDLFRLNNENKQVIAGYNAWYTANRERFHRYRLPVDSLGKVWRAPGENDDFIFMLNDACRVDVDRNTTLLNGTFNRELLVRTRKPGKTGVKAKVHVTDCVGTEAVNVAILLDGWTAVPAVPGGKSTISM